MFYYLCYNDYKPYYFYNTNENIKKYNKDKNKINDIMLKFNESESFVNSINVYLIDAINEYIENETINDEDTDF